MALTIAEIAGAENVPGTIGNRRAVLRKVTFDNSYAAGGESLVPADFGLASIDAVFFAPEIGAAWVPAYDYTNQKVVLYAQEPGNAAGAGDTIALRQADAADDVSATVLRVLAVGV